MASILLFRRCRRPIPPSLNAPDDSFFNSPNTPDAHNKLDLLARHDPDAAQMVERVLDDCLIPIWASLNRQREW